MSARPLDTIYLAIDGGGTATRATLHDANGNAIATETEGPSNPVSLGLPVSLATLSQLGCRLLEGKPPEACIVAAGISGARNQPLRDAIAGHLLHALGVRRVLVSSDVDVLVHANLGSDAGIVVIAGTGSSVIAKAVGKDPRLFGGRGELFGDVGSAYQIAVRGLQVAGDSLDGLAESTELVKVLPSAVGVDAFAELVGWSQGAPKHEVARLAPYIMELAATGDAAARRCVLEQVELLAKLTASAANQLNLSPPISVYVHGGLFEKPSTYFERFAEALEAQCERGHFDLDRAPLSGTAAGLQLAIADVVPAFVSVADSPGDVVETYLLPTESMDIKATPLDRLTAGEIASRMGRADREAVDAVTAAQRSIAALLEGVARRFQEGGRLIYLGAGTSGRLGVLDASECPPTFGVDPGQVIGIIAGGDNALHASVEGAEDDERAAVTDLDALRPPLGRRDVVVGIAASGTTPYVRAGLSHAKERRAYTALVCCNPLIRSGADCVIALNTGPEVLPGSTRLKAGTATKLVLNAISTGAMALSGRIFEGYMIGVQPLNAKLRHRACRIVAALTACAEEEASARLDRAGDNIAVAVLMARRNLTRSEAEKRLTAAKGSLRDALEAD